MAGVVADVVDMSICKLQMHLADRRQVEPQLL